MRLGLRCNSTHFVLMLSILMLGIAMLFLTSCQLPMRVDGSTEVVAQAETSATPKASETTTPPPQTATATETATPTSTATATVAPTSSPTAVPSTAKPSLVPAATATDDGPTPVPTSTYPPPPTAVDVPILMYHYVSEIPEEADIYRRDLTVTPDRFRAQMQVLKEQGYTTVTLADIYATLTEGAPLPSRPIVLTFDDGYKDAYTHVMPLLQEFGFVGEFFVLATPAHYESPAYITWSEMKEMSDAGMSMQAHGRDHVDLTNRPNDFLVYQILGAREAVEAHAGQPVRFFCYPSGRHDADTEAVVASAGYWGAVTTAWGTELRLDNRYTWPRIRIRGAWGEAEFASVLESLKGGD